MELPSVRLVHEGAALEGRIALPESPGPHPAVLVMHNAHGLGPHMIEVARRLARQGYVALAADMYGGGVHHADREAAGRSIAPLWRDPDLLRSRVRSWYECIKARAEVDARRVAAIGYCFGGQCVLDLARSGADVRAVFSYHGILKTQRPARAGEVKALVSVYTGSRDPYAPFNDLQAFREEMIAAGARWQLTEFSDAYHAFTDYRLASEPADGLAYDPLSERVSWAGTLSALAAVLSNTVLPSPIREV